MASVRPEILWSPTVDNNFLIWSTNLQLYEVLTVEPDQDLSPPKIRLSEKTAANVIATNNDHQYIKCVAWYYGLRDDPSQQIIAIGQANGRIALTSFIRSTDVNSVIGKEFVPKSARAVNSLAWNPQYHQYLAAGLDKAGKDHSIIVIDVMRGSPTTSFNFEPRNLNNSEILKPVLEWSTGETGQSVEFSKHSPETLFAGVTNRQIGSLKLFDIREGKLITSVTTKAVFGIASDPFNIHRFASYVDNVVHIWDIRNIERPVLTLTDSNNKSIFKLSWCPTRYGFLSSLSRESSSIRLYDIQQHGSEGEDQEPAVINQSISTELNTLISSFAWHPTQENRILTASYSGKLIDHIVHERVTLNWSVTNTLVWSHGKKTLQQIDESHPVFEDFSDISTLIKERAVMKYGLQKKKLALNGEITRDPALITLWTWLEEAHKLSQNTSFKLAGGGTYKYQGVLPILNSGTLKSDILNKQWIGVEGTKAAYAKVFKSDERNLALTLCSWGFEDEEALKQFLDNLVSGGFYTRAAAVAVFNLHIPLAIKILQKGAFALNKPAFNTTAMALAGFTSERKALWRETCSSLLQHISDPYLRTTFAFLTEVSETFDSILKEKNIVIHDRVAFACKYLSDARLLEFLENLKANLTKEGNLDGILLTGLDTEGQDLLQHYIDLTGDIQTPALVAVHSLQPYITTDTRLQHWIESYRHLLDSLQLWKERAQMDVMINQGKYVKKIAQQIYISCNFCMKSISAYIQTPGRSRNPYARFGTGATNKLKMTACPNCRKPLPRCSLCLQHMGTPSKRGSISGKGPPPMDENATTNGDQNAESNPNPAKALSQFNNWFTWCQNCRHGGHAQHMIQWFKENSECPVASCSCKCMSIDAVNKLGPQSCLVKQ